jgi:signal transduction histidine kinase
MESMIDDMLGLARAGKAVTTTSECSLADSVEDVWETVQTDGAELDCRVGETTVEADPVRLFQALENLFRNALDHNDPPLTLRVGTFNANSGHTHADTPTGMYIEDDGRGITVDERDDIFEHGYTTNEDGNGYGLSVVQHIVDAHDWEIRVTDGTDGGARFEIVGIGPD